MRLDGLFPEVVGHHIRVHAVDLEAEGAGLGPGLLGPALGPRVEAVVLGEEVEVGGHPEGGPVDLVLPEGPLHAAQDRAGEVLDQLLGVGHHPGEVAVGLVELEHRELGVVAPVDALVAEVPVDLKDPREPGDQQPLEVQLRGDPQEQLQVQRVVVGDEGPGGGPAGHRLHHRGLDLQEAAGLEEVPGRLDQPRAGLQGGQPLGAAPEVHVPAAVALLGVGEPVELARGQGQALGQQPEGEPAGGVGAGSAGAGPDGDLPGLGGRQRAAGGDQVRQIHELCDLEDLGPDGLLRDGHLEVPPAVVPQREEDQVAHQPLLDDAAGDRGHGPVVPGLGVLLEPAVGLGVVGGPGLGQRHQAVLPGAEGVDPELVAELVELRPAGGQQLLGGGGGGTPGGTPGGVPGGVVLPGRRRGVVGHGGWGEAGDGRNKARLTGDPRAVRPEQRRLADPATPPQATPLAEPPPAKKPPAGGGVRRWGCRWRRVRRRRPRLSGRGWSRGGGPGSVGGRGGGGSCRRGRGGSRGGRGGCRPCG